MWLTAFFWISQTDNIFLDLIIMNIDLLISTDLKYSKSCNALTLILYQEKIITQVFYYAL